MLSQKAIYAFIFNLVKIPSMPNNSIFITTDGAIFNMLFLPINFLMLANITSPLLSISKHRRQI